MLPTELSLIMMKNIQQCMLFITGPILPSSHGHLELEDTSRRRKLGDFMDHIVLINSGEREEMSQSKLYLEKETFPDTILMCVGLI